MRGNIQKKMVTFVKCERQCKAPAVPIILCMMCEFNQVKKYQHLDKKTNKSANNKIKEMGRARSQSL
jgi:hypothetical protein